MRPHCLTCGMELTPVYQKICSACGESVHHHAHGPEEKFKERRGGACDLIYDPPGRYGFSQRIVVDKKIHGFGYLSNGKFCSMSCGYHWAVKNAPR